MAIPAWLELMRLKNVMLALPTVYIGAWISSPENWFNDYLLDSTILAISVATFMGAGNTFNDIRDYENDLVNHPARVLPSGRITLDSAKQIALLFSISSLLSIIAYSILFYSENNSLPVATLLIWIIATVLIATYESGPRTKDQGFVGNLVISVMVGLVIIFGASVSLGHFDYLIICVAATAMVINLAREILKDCEDMLGDEGRNTLPMRIGVEKARSAAYLVALVGMILAALPYYLELNGISVGLLALQIPTVLNLITLNGVILNGDDSHAQKRLRVAMATGLIGFILTVAVS